MARRRITIAQLRARVMSLLESAPPQHDSTPHGRMCYVLGVIEGYAGFTDDEVARIDRFIQGEKP